MQLELQDFGCAIELAQQNLKTYNEKLIKLRDNYIYQIQNQIPNCKINGSKTNRLPGNINISFPFIEGEELLLNLDEKGICASTGSACSSATSNPSHVLLAIGLQKELAYSSLRITIGEENTQEDIDFLVNQIVEIISKIKRKV